MPDGNSGCLADKLLKWLGKHGVVDLWHSVCDDFVKHHERAMNYTEDAYSIRLAGHLSPDKIRGMLGADVGCGGGVMSRYMASNGASVVAVDISYNSVKYTVQSGGIVGVQANAERLPYKDCVFDFCLCTDVIEHIPSYQRALEEVHRTLKPGSFAVMAIPNSQSSKNLLLDLIFPAFKGLLKKALGGEPPRPSRGHLHLFSRKSFSNMMDELGFDVEETSTVTVADVSRNRFITLPVSTLVGLLFPSTLDDQLIFNVRKRKGVFI